MGAVPPGVPRGDLSYDEVRLRRARLALRREELEYEQEVGRLCLVQEALDYIGAVGRAVRRSFDALEGDLCVLVPESLHREIRLRVRMADDRVDDEIRRHTLGGGAGGEGPPAAGG